MIIAKADDPQLKAALETYHKEKIDSSKAISERLLADHGIQMSYVKFLLVLHMQS